MPIIRQLHKSFFITKMIHLWMSLKSYINLACLYLVNAVFLAVMVPFLNPLTTNVPNHIETIQLICNANQLTGICMMRNTGR